MAIIILASVVMAIDAYLDDRDYWASKAVYIATVPMQLIARAGDAVSRWHAKTDNWGK